MCQYLFGEVTSNEQTTSKLVVQESLVETILRMEVLNSQHGIVAGSMENSKNKEETKMSEVPMPTGCFHATTAPASAVRWVR